MIMKKISLISVLFLCVVSSNAQFFRGIGIFGAVTQSMHRYKNKDEGLKDPLLDNPLNFNMDAYYPPTHFSREKFDWGAGVFAEFLSHDKFRWQTEFEFTHKGAKEKEITDFLFGTRSESFGKNRYTYIQWNNYLKYFSPFNLPSNYYLMLGVRLEYLFQTNASVFNGYSDQFRKIWFNPDAAIGYEFPLFRKISMFAEYHYNPDVIPLKVKNVSIRNRTFELRVGLIYRPRRRAIDDCNAPRYNGPAY
jgi:hypothetical protein